VGAFDGGRVEEVPCRAQRVAWVLAVGALLGVAAFAPMYIDLKAEHICDLYVLTTETLSKPPKSVMHDVPRLAPSLLLGRRVRVFSRASQVGDLGKASHFRTRGGTETGWQI